MLFFTSEAHVRLYRSTVVTLLKFPTASMRTSETALVSKFCIGLRIASVTVLDGCVQMLEKFDQNTREGKCSQSPAWDQYMKEYEEEIGLNEEFDRFVANFQLAYEGPNTAHAQTGSKYETRKLDLIVRRAGCILWSLRIQ